MSLIRRLGLHAVRPLPQERDFSLTVRLSEYYRRQGSVQARAAVVISRPLPEARRLFWMLACREAS